MAGSWRRWTAALPGISVRAATRSLRRACGKAPSYRRCRCDAEGTHVAMDETMGDLIVVAVVAAFFALSIAYTRACDRL
jgi:hypothetical protein